MYFRKRLVAVLLAGLVGLTPGRSQGAQFASDRPEAVKPAPFDAKRGMGYLADLCKIGPRISGSDGMHKQRELLVQHFEKLGGKIEWQKFTARQVSQREPVEMAN